MKIVLTEEEIKYAVLVHVFSKTGMRMQPEECDIHFVKDGSGTRVDSVSLIMKE